jgi:hypothetical protein
MRRLVLAALAALVFAAAASADDVVVPLTIRPGGLTLAPATTLSRGARVSVSVTDARGHGAGWTLFARTAGPGATLVYVTGVDSACGRDSTCTLPRTNLRYPILLSPLRDVPVLVARPGTGMGMFSITLRLGRRAASAQGAIGAGGAALRFAVRPS